MLVDYLRKELEKKERIVEELEHFVILVPFWACKFEIIVELYKKIGLLKT